MLEKDLASGADQAHLALLAAKEQQGWLVRALRQPVVLLYPFFSSLSLAELLAAHLPSCRTHLPVFLRSLQAILYRVSGEKQVTQSQEDLCERAALRLN